MASQVMDDEDESTGGINGTSGKGGPSSNGPGSRGPSGGVNGTSGKGGPSSNGSDSRQPSGGVNGGSTGLGNNGGDSDGSKLLVGGTINVTNEMGNWTGVVTSVTGSDVHWGGGSGTGNNGGDKGSNSDKAKAEANAKAEAEARAKAIAKKKAEDEAKAKAQAAWEAAHPVEAAQIKLQSAESNVSKANDKKSDAQRRIDNSQKNLQSAIYKRDSDKAIGYIPSPSSIPAVQEIRNQVLDLLQKNEDAVNKYNGELNQANSDLAKSNQELSKAIKERDIAKSNLKKVQDEEEIKLVKDASKFTADFYKELTSKYGENSARISKELADSAKGKKLRNADVAVKAFDKYKGGINKKFSAQDRQAINSALESLNRDLMAKNLAKFAKAFGVVGAAIDYGELVNEVKKGFATGEWKGAILKAESLVAGKLASFLVAFTFGVMTASPLGILGFAVLMTLTSALIDDALMDKMNNYVMSL
jgi:hypothetical protein